VKANEYFLAMKRKLLEMKTESNDKA